MGRAIKGHIPLNGNSACDSHASASHTIYSYFPSFRPLPFRQRLRISEERRRRRCSKYSSRSWPENVQSLKGSLKSLKSVRFRSACDPNGFLLRAHIFAYSLSAFGVAMPCGTTTFCFGDQDNGEDEEGEGAGTK